MKIAILDDYPNVALSMADWSGLKQRADITVFNNTVTEVAEIVARLKPFDIVCVMRERTRLTRAVIEQLPQLKLIASTGPRNAAIDTTAAAERGIEIMHTGYDSSATVELTWALILASARHLIAESKSLSSGGWQHTIGDDLRGKTLAALGLGNMGEQVARIAKVAFGMDVIAWSQNLTSERASAVGATLVSKEQLFRDADFLTIHLILSGRTRGLVTAAELDLMKPTARLINTSRGPIVDEAALISCLQGGHIAGAALDVFDQEPLPVDHPFRSMPNVLASPHLGYVGDKLFRLFYTDTVTNITAWLDRQAPA